jgi:tetratricopeptide (TPR) repeat protein
MKKIAWIICVVMLACLPVAEASTAGAGSSAGPDAKRTSRDRQVAGELDAFDRALAQGQFPQALQVFEAVRAKHPDHPLVLAYQGRILMIQNKASEAAAVLQKALAKDPTQPWAVSLMANLDYRLGKTQEAQLLVDKALMAHPDAWQLLQIDAQIKMAQRDGDTAETLLKKIVTNPANPDAVKLESFALLGSISISRDDHHSAAEYLGKALAIRFHPGVAMAHIIELDKDHQSGAALKAIAIMREHLGGSDPRMDPIRKQFAEKIVPIETRLVQAQSTPQFKRIIQAMGQIDQEIAARDFKPDKARKDLDIVREATAHLKDVTEKGKAEAGVNLLVLRLGRRTLTDGVTANASRDWQLAHAEALIRVAAKVNTDEGRDAVLYANAIIEKANSAGK